MKQPRAARQPASEEHTSVGSVGSPRWLNPPIRLESQLQLRHLDAGVRFGINALLRFELFFFFFFWVFSSSRVWMWELEHKESWAQNWCFWTVVLEKTRRLLRVPWTARRSNQSILKEISPEKWKGWCWSWNYNTLTTWWEELTLWERPWCWERLKAGGEGDDRGWYGWMASSTQWTWVWVNSGSWWWTGRPGVLQSTGSRRVGHNWGTELSLLWAPDSEHVATTSGQWLLSRFQCQPTWRPVSLGLQWIPDHVKSIQVRTRWHAGSPSRVSLQSISIYTKCIYKTTRLALFSFPHFATS